MMPDAKVETMESQEYCTINEKLSVKVETYPEYYIEVTV